MARRLFANPLLMRARRIALYLANDGEIDPMPLLAGAVAMGKRCYLPRLKPSHGQPRRNELWFFRYEPGAPLEANRYGIPEPLAESGKRIAAQALDLVLLPLVAFDRAGNRLGMGAGYYDQTFAFTRAPNCWHRPRLLGLAHDWQLVESLPARSWDIPLDGAATDLQVYSFAATPVIRQDPQ